MSDSRRAARWWVAAAALVVTVLAALPAAAQPSGTTSISLPPGGTAVINVNSNAQPQFVCACQVTAVGTSGGSPTWRITVRAADNATPGTYTGTVSSADPAGSYSVTVNITNPPPTTTTTTTAPPPPPPTTTTTTTEPPTTTTEPPTTTTEPPTTTTTEPPTTTTTEPPTTTTTEPPTTTTTTFLPPTTSGGSAQGRPPTGWLIGGAAALAGALALAGLIGARRRSPAYSRTGAGTGIKRWFARRDLDRRRKGGPSRKRFHGPEWWQDWRSARRDERDVRRRIDERRRRP